MKKQITYDELLNKIPNKYVLAIISGERAREIGRGATPLTKISSKDTVTTQTFKEIVDGKITFTEKDLNEKELELGTDGIEKIIVAEEIAEIEE